MKDRFLKLFIWTITMPILWTFIAITLITFAISKKLGLRLKHNNCIVFSLSKWIASGGYIVIRASHHGWWPHFIWAKNLDNTEIQHFVPTEDVPPNHYRSELFFFDGEAKNTDTEFHQ